MYQKELFPAGLEISPSTRILDSGTGSGTSSPLRFYKRELLLIVLTLKAEWLMNVSKVVPEDVRLDGIDVTSSLLPKTYPRNVHFTITSATTLPPDWSNNFDLVHQRLLLPSLRLTDWTEAISEHFRILKPGGYAMFVELSPDWPGGEGLGASERVRDIVMSLHESRGLPFDCALRIPGWLRDAGFIDIEVKERRGPLGKKLGELGELGVQNHGTVYRNMKGALMKGERIGSGEEYDELIDEVIKEWDDVGAHYVWHLIIARKPL